MSSKRKIAVFGGSFNPVHNGHINLCRKAIELFDFHKFLFMPVKLPPHKSAVKLVSCTDRLNMLKLAVEDINGVAVSDLEVSGRLGDKSYTINTVCALKEDYPDDKYELYWLIGSDMLYTFDKWYKHEEILKKAFIIAAAREENELEKLYLARERFGELSKRIEIASFDALVVSSTDIRNRISHREDISKLVPAKVVDYIKLHKLYEE